VIDIVALRDVCSFQKQIILKIYLMEKIIHCRDAGFDCNGVIRAKTEEEALRLAAEHAKTVHGLKEVTPQIVEKIKSVMRDVRTNS
jgi:predicted small metal-binding protein